MATTATKRREVFKDVGQYFQYEKGYVHMDIAGIKERFGVDVPALKLAGDAFPIYNQLVSQVIGEPYNLKNPKGYMPLKKSAYQVLEDAYVEAYRHNLDKYEEGRTLTKDQKVATYFMLKKGIEKIPDDIKRNLKDCADKHKDQFESGTVTKTRLKEVKGDDLEILAENVANATMAIVDMESKKRRVAYRYGADGRRERLKALFETRDKAMVAFLEKAMEPYQVDARDVFEKAEAVDISSVMTDLRAMMGITTEDVNALSQQLTGEVKQVSRPNDELIPGVTRLYDGDTLAGFKYQDATIVFKDNASVKAVDRDGSLMLYTDKTTGVRLTNVEGPMTITVDTGKVDLTNVKTSDSVMIKGTPEGTVVADSQLSGYTVITGGQIKGSTLTDVTATQSTLTNTQVTSSQVMQSVLTDTRVEKSELSAAYLVDTTATDAKVTRSGLVHETVTGEVANVLSVSGTAYDSKADFKAAMTQPNLSDDVSETVDIPYLSVIDDVTLHYQLPEQDKMIIKVPTTKDMTMDKLEDGFVIGTPDNATVTVKGDISVMGGDLRVVAEPDSSVTLDTVSVNNWHQDNTITATSGQSTTLQKVSFEDWCTVENAMVIDTTLSHVDVEGSTVEDSQLLDSSVRGGSNVLDSQVTSSTIYQSDVMASQLVKASLNDDKTANRRYLFDKVTYEDKERYEALVADYKAHPDDYLGEFTGPLTKVENGYVLDKLAVNNKDLKAVRISETGAVSATFENDATLTVSNVTAEERVAVQVDDSVNLSNVTFKGYRNAIKGNVTVTDSDLVDGTVVSGHTTIDSSTVDSSSLEDVSVASSYLCDVDYTKGSVVQSEVKNSQLVDANLSQLATVEECRVSQSTLKGSGKETVVFSEFVDSTVDVQTSVKHSAVAYATVTLDQETSHVLGDKTDKVTVYRDVDAYEKAVMQVSQGASYDDVTGPSEPMPDLVKEDVSVATDFDQYVGDEPVTYEAPSFEDMMAVVGGPTIPLEPEVTSDVSKPFELDMSADLSAFDIMNAMRTVDQMQQDAMVDIDPDQFIIEGVSSSQGL